MTSIRSLVVCALLFGLFASARSEAATFVVTSIQDGFDALPGDRRCFASIGCTLRAAIQEAEALPGEPHTIILPAGTYHLRIAGRLEDFSETGDLDIRGDIIIVGFSVPPRYCPTGCIPMPGEGTVVNAYRIDRHFEVHEGGRLTVRNVVLTRGDVASDPVGGFGDTGGSIRNVGRLRLENAVVTESVAVVGGGIANVGQVELMRAAITSNMATFVGFPVDVILTGGGGIYSTGELVVDSSYIAYNTSFAQGGGVLTRHTFGSPSGSIFLDTQVASNRSGHGGGLYISGTVRALRLNVHHNAATAGNGGGMVLDPPFSGPLVVEESRIEHNTAVDSHTSDCPDPAECGQGGGVFARGATLVSTTIANNTAHGNGGGAVLANALIRDSTVSGNTAFGRGGGIAMRRGSTSQDAGLFNSTVSGNRSHGGGGGIYVHPRGGGGFQFTTIAMNRSATAGDGVYVDTDAVVEFKATVLSRNGGANCLFNARPFSFGWNRWDITPYDACTTNLTRSGDDSGSIGLDPLRNNGGLTETHAISAFSIARDAIAPGSCTLSTLVTGEIPLPADQRGTTRPQGTQCDAGAYETSEPIRIIWIRCCERVIFRADIAMTRARSAAIALGDLMEKSQEFEGMKAANALVQALQAAAKASTVMINAPDRDQARAAFADLSAALGAARKPWEALAQFRQIDVLAYERVEGALAAVGQLLPAVRKAVRNAK